MVIDNHAKQCYNRKRVRDLMSSLVGSEFWEKEPPPTESETIHPAIWDLVIADLSHANYSHPKQIEAVNLFIEDILLRDKTGEAKYGTRLKPFNGRRAKKDAYEEFCDAVVYLRQDLYEQEKTNGLLVTPETEFYRQGVMHLYTLALDAAMKLRFMLEKEKGQNGSKESEGDGNSTSNESSLIDTGNNRNFEELRHD